MRIAFAFLAMALAARDLHLPAMHDLARIPVCFLVSLILALAGCGEPSGSPLDDAGALVPREDADTGRVFRGVYPLDARFPEGGTYDAQTHAFFVGSLGDGSVHRIDAETGAQRLLFRESAPGTWWTLGMDVDSARRRLHVCAMEDRRELEGGDVPYDGYVWTFDADSGERLATVALADAFPDATCTDVAVAADGTLYVCDREHPNLYRIDAEGSVSLFVTDDALDGAVVGQNALVVLPDQSALLSVVYLPSRLVRISLPEGAVREVDIDGDFLDGTPFLSGADGMTYSDGEVLVAFTSQLVRLTPTLADWSQARSTSVDVPEGMTDVIHTPESDYMLNGQAVDFAFDREPRPFELVAITR